jgi:hypothetical protein
MNLKENLIFKKSEKCLILGMQYVRRYQKVWKAIQFVEISHFSSFPKFPNVTNSELYSNLVF